MDAEDSRKLMLIALGLGIALFSLWTAFLVFSALMAESGGKNSNPLLAMALLWPVVELIWSWTWLARHAGQYARSKRRSLGNALTIGAVVAPPALAGILIFFHDRKLDWLFYAPVAITIVNCQAARWLWSRDGEAAQQIAG